VIGKDEVLHHFYDEVAAGVSKQGSAPGYGWRMSLPGSRQAVFVRKAALVSWRESECRSGAVLLIRITLNGETNTTGLCFNR
jgi:hypothetical protein